MAAEFQYSSTVARMRPPPTMHHLGDKLCLCSLRISRFLRILVTSLDFILLGVVCDTCVDMPKRREEKIRRVLPTGSENVRRRLDLEAGEGTSAHCDPPVRCPCVDARVRAPHAGSGPIQTIPQKHHGVAYLGASDVAWGAMSKLDIDGYIMQMERDQADEVPRVRDEWSSEDDITPDEDSGDEYLPHRRR